MPHRVASFFRSSTSSLESQISSFKKGNQNVTKNNHNSTPRRLPSPPTTTHRQHSRSSGLFSSYASSIEEGSEQESQPTAAAAPPLPGRMSTDKHDSHTAAESHHNGGHHHLHRLSFPGFVHLGRTSKESHINTTAELSLQVESPPIVFHGDAENSSGALVSGQLFLDVKEDGLPLESFTATLNIHVTQKRPFAPHCPQCANQYTELKTWTFLPAPLSLTKGVHQFPFSVLLGGHLPASTDGSLMSIAYEFKAEAVPKPGHGSPIKTEKVFDVKRSLPTHETPHHSVRVFPPTNIKASVHFPQVIHPTGVNTLTLRMDGIAKPNERNGTLEYWKLKKLTWRLEETAKTVAPACDKHAPVQDPKDPAAPSVLRKGIERNDMRIVGERTLFSGWKSNYDSLEDASVDLELEYGLGKNFGGSGEPEGSGASSKEKKRYACDGKSADGTEVSHQLMVEMVVSQEWAPQGKPALVSQTGVGRILRMHFGTVLTERGGIGISWDNEAPPIYQDVPPSPPGYCPDAAARRAIAEASLEDVVDVQMLDGEMPPAWTPSPALSRTASGNESISSQIYDDV